MSEHIFKRFRPGQRKLSAANFNAMIDALRSAQATESKQKQTPPNQTYILNATGSDLLEAYAVLQVDEVYPDMDEPQGVAVFRRKALLIGIAPDVDDIFSPGHNKIAITQGGAKNGGFVKCITAGVVQCRINMIDSGHKWAHLADGDTEKLVSDTTGTAYILAVDSGTGTKWAAVLLNANLFGGNPLFAEATSAPSSGTLTVKLANSDGTLVGDNITVYDGGMS